MSERNVRVAKFAGSRGGLCTGPSTSKSEDVHQHANFIGPRGAAQGLGAVMLHPHLGA